jgi:hypothetical protein
VIRKNQPSFYFSASLQSIETIIFHNFGWVSLHNSRRYLERASGASLNSCASFLDNKLAHAFGEAAVEELVVSMLNYQYSTS